MFEITADDIARLDDEKLRAVVARLCEAELRQRGLSSSCVTWGGNQSASDGGIDVRVALPPDSTIDGFVPRPATGFQAKQQDMRRAEILKEMRPDGIIRPSIQALADRSGAYIIVSSQGSTADTALTSRRDAMVEAMQGVPNADQLLLDFYDRTRLATWVRSHEGLIPWVREQVGRAIVGWHSYGSWAYAPDPVTAEYLFDDKLRIHPNRRDTGSGVSALEGIRQMRNQLREPRSVVRLVGLSGVGKTRLVQALFDERVGVENLNPSLAIYTNMADSPDPQPTEIASELVLARTPAILDVDNCPPELHQRLSEVCRQRRSKLSVITVEYDIREDDPEGTEVFTLETSSPELIEKLLRQRFPAISQIDARTIAGFSGGNARIAIALAATIESNGTVAGLTDDQLFQRLFVQRHAPDESLYLVAQACSLVYSFEGERVDVGDDAELTRLGAMIGKTAQEVYRHVAELRRRDLVQQRGVWRAVLPHAIANRLAAIALQNIPYVVIDEQLLGAPSGHLMKSFSRRLGYLHTSEEANAIVKNWLRIGGLLGNVGILNDLGLSMFENVAPVAPEDVLAAIERTLPEPQGTAACKKHFDLLRSFAYDPALFERSIAAMVEILAAEDVPERAHETQLFANLFHVCLSGTHATIEQRLTVIEHLLTSPDAKRRDLGALALKAALEALHFNPNCRFEFGARSRDYGYSPRTREEIDHWFGTTLQLVATLACAEGPEATHARTALAEKFRGLWLGERVPDELANVCCVIGRNRFWPEGWVAVWQTLDFDGKGLEPDRLAMLTAIEVGLRPADLLQKVRSMVFSTSLHVDFDDLEVRQLGQAVAAKNEVLDELLPELVSNNGRLWEFGRGLLQGSTDAEMVWHRLVSALTKTDESLRKPQVLAGFLHNLRARNPTLATAVLDNAVEHETLAPWYPVLQVAVDIEHEDVERLERSLALGKAPIERYRRLAYGRAVDRLPAQDLKELVLSIAATPSGRDVATEILHMRLFSDEHDKKAIAPELIDAGCELMRQLAFTTTNAREDYRLGALAKTCLRGAKGSAIAREICQNFRLAVARHEMSVFPYDDLLDGLFNAQPIASLDGLCNGDAEELELGIRILQDVGASKCPLNAVPEEDLLSWCDLEPQTRYPAIADLITTYQRTSEKTPPRWTQIALRFLEKAPDPEGTLHRFVSQFRPSSGWSGSLPAILESNAALLDQLEAYPALSVIITQEKERLQKWIHDERCRLTAWGRETDERFE
jgi:hypothetical protein